MKLHCLCNKRSSNKVSHTNRHQHFTLTSPRADFLSLMQHTAGIGVVVREYRYEEVFSTSHRCSEQLLFVRQIDIRSISNRWVWVKERSALFNWHVCELIQYPFQSTYFTFLWHIGPVRLGELILPIKDQSFYYWEYCQTIPWEERRISTKSVCSTKINTL